MGASPYKIKLRLPHPQSYDKVTLSVPTTITALIAQEGLSVDALSAQLVLIGTTNPEGDHVEFGDRLQASDAAFPGMKAFTSLVWPSGTAVPGLTTNGFKGLLYTPVWSSHRATMMDAFLTGPANLIAGQLGAELRLVEGRLLVARSAANPDVMTHGTLLYWQSGDVTNHEVRQIAASFGELGKGRNGLHNGQGLELAYRMGDGGLVVLQLWDNPGSLTRAIPKIQGVLGSFSVPGAEVIVPLRVPIGGYGLPKQPLAYVWTH